MSEPDALPTYEEREKLCEILSRVLIDIRLLGWGGKAEQAADLADVFHNLPGEMYGRGRFNWRLVRGLAAEYQARYPVRVTDYVALFDAIRLPSAEDAAK